MADEEDIELVGKRALKEMLESKAKLETQDREDAVNVMMWFLHYEVSARATSGSEVELFHSDEDMVSFCVNNNLKLPAVKKLLEDMQADGLIVSRTMPIKLTTYGVNKLCQ